MCEYFQYMNIVRTKIISRKKVKRKVPMPNLELVILLKIKFEIKKIRFEFKLS